MKSFKNTCFKGVFDLNVGGKDVKYDISVIFLCPRSSTSPVPDLEKKGGV